MTGLASDDWTREDDDAISGNSNVMDKWRRGENEMGDEKPLTSTELSELLGKSIDAVILRARLLDHWILAGIEEPPKVLSEKISISKRLMARLWWRMGRYSERNDCTLTDIIRKLVKRLFVIKTGVEQDVDAFFRAKANELQGQCNMRDVEKA